MTIVQPPTLSLIAIRGLDKKYNKMLNNVHYYKDVTMQVPTYYYVKV